MDAKIAEINAAMGKNRVLSVEDTAMYNAAKKGLKTSRETLVRFDDAFQAFTRSWDKVKLGQLGVKLRGFEQQILEQGTLSSMAKVNQK